jgi:hypothetical protein
MSDYGLYEGPRHGKGDEDYVSREWCGGIVMACARYPDYPHPTRYSRAVGRRIRRAAYVAPGRTLAQLLKWAA